MIGKRSILEFEALLQHTYTYIMKMAVLLLFECHAVTSHMILSGHVIVKLSLCTVKNSYVKVQYYFYVIRIST